MKFIYAKDLTPLFVDHSVINLMKTMIDGPTTFDFTGVNVMDRALEALARIVIDTEVNVHGLQDDSRQLFDAFVLKLNEPEYASIEEFETMFLAKFPVGTLCIWDKSLSKKLDPSEIVYSLVYIEGIEKNHVVFRNYYSHLIEPAYFAQYGGLDAKELYALDRIHVSDFATKEVLFRYPKSQKEEIILDLLKRYGSGEFKY